MWGSGCLCCGGQGGRPQAPGLRGCGRPPGEGAHGSAPPPATPTGRVLANREAALECSPVLGVGPRRGGAQGLASPAAPASAGHVCVCVHTCVSVSALTQLRLGGASLGSGSEGDAAQPPPRGSPVVSHSVWGGGCELSCFLSLGRNQPVVGGVAFVSRAGPCWKDLCPAGEWWLPDEPRGGSPGTLCQRPLSFPLCWGNQGTGAPGDWPAVRGQVTPPPLPRLP